jgi:DNA-binding response OmpR family regulator
MVFMVRSSRKIRILCVDDHLETREVLSAIFDHAGYETVSCATMSEGLSFATTLDFDLYLFDIQLPDGTGIDLARRVRAFDTQTPLIFLSASAYPEDIAAGMKAGAQDYIVKPMSMDHLLETVRRLLKVGNEEALRIKCVANHLAT